MSARPRADQTLHLPGFPARPALSLCFCVFRVWPTRPPPGCLCFEAPRKAGCGRAERGRERACSLVCEIVPPRPKTAMLHQTMGSQYIKAQGKGWWLLSRIELLGASIQVASPLMSLVRAALMPTGQRAAGAEKRKRRK